MFAFLIKRNPTQAHRARCGAIKLVAKCYLLYEMITVPKTTPNPVNRKIKCKVSTSNFLISLTISLCIIFVKNQVFEKE